MVMTNPWTHSRTQLARGQDGGADGSGWAAHDGAAGLVKAEGDRDGDVDDHVDPQDLQGGEGDPTGDGEDPSADEDGDVGDQGRHLEAEVFEEVVVQVAAVVDRLDDGGEVVVGQDHDRGFFGDLGAGDAHGDPDVGRLEGGGVIDPVPGHGDHVAALFEQPDQAQLVLGGDPGHDPDLGQLADQLGRRSWPRTRPR